MKLTMIILAILVYMIVVMYIGVQCSKANKSSDDFYLGGRKLGPFVTAMSAEASDMSSWLLMGLPGVALLTGVSGGTSGFAEAFWTALGLGVGTYLNWLIVSRRIRIYSEKNKSATIPDFFSNRFGDKSGILTLIAAVVIIIFFVPYTGSGFAAIGKLFNSLFGVDYHTALIVGGAVIVFYTMTGGFLAASTTDFIQSIVMTVALFVIVCFGVENAGGMAAVAENAKALTASASLSEYFSLTGLDGSYGFLPIVSTLAWGLGYFGMPHILLRFMAIEDSNKLTLSRRIATVWVFISMSIAIVIGYIGLTFAVNHGYITDGIAAEGFDAERIIIYMSDTIADIDSFAAVIAGLILAGILAATMSTADSQLLAAASSVSEKYRPPFRMEEHSRKEADVDCPYLRCTDFRCRSDSRMESRQLRLPDCIVRMGRLRCGVRSRYAFRTVLETHDQTGCSCRHDFGRCDGLPLEVRHQPSRRCVCHL